MINELNRRNRSTIPADPTPRDLLAPLFRRKRVLGLSLLALLLVAVAGTVYLSNIYKCSMEVLVNRERLDPTVTSEATNQMPTMTPPVSEEDINSEVELIQSRDLLQQVV